MRRTHLEARAPLGALRQGRDRWATNGSDRRQGGRAGAWGSHGEPPAARVWTAARQKPKRRCARGTAHFGSDGGTPPQPIEPQVCSTELGTRRGHWRKWHLIEAVRQVQGASLHIQVGAQHIHRLGRTGSYKPVCVVWPDLSRSGGRSQGLQLLRRGQLAEPGTNAPSTDTLATIHPDKDLWY